MILTVKSYDLVTRCAVLAAHGKAAGEVIILSNVSLEQAEAMCEKLARHWRERDDVRGQPAGVYLTR